MAGVNSETPDLCITISRRRSATPIFQGSILRSMLIGVPRVHMYSLSMAQLCAFAFWPTRTKAHPWSWKWGLTFPQYSAEWGEFWVLLELRKGEWILSR